MNMDLITRREIVELMLTIGGMVIGLIIPIVTIIVKLAVDKAKLQSLEYDRMLEKEMINIRNNYLERFEEIRKDITDLRILIENKFNVLEKKILENRK